MVVAAGHSCNPSVFLYRPPVDAFHRSPLAEEWWVGHGGRSDWSITTHRSDETTPWNLRVGDGGTTAREHDLASYYF